MALDLEMYVYIAADIFEDAQVVSTCTSTAPSSLEDTSEVCHMFWSLISQALASLCHTSCILP